MTGSRSGLDATQCLAIEIAGYRALIDLLHGEQDALRRADADALSAVVSAKVSQIASLEAIAAARAATIKAMGFTPDRAGVQAWLSSQRDRESAVREWTTLVGLADYAQRQNRINYHLAAIQERHVDRAITALWNAAGAASTYGADGRSHHAAAPRELASV